MGLSGGADLHPFQLELFEAALGPGMVVVDCGAHIGLYSVLAAQRVGSSGRVVALEPDEPNLRALHGNLVANDVADRVEVVDAAASDHAGTASFYLYEDNSARTTSSLSPLPGLAATEVRCVTLDEVLAGRRVDVAKIDVEGAESLVLGGMSETLERSPGATFFIECHPPPLGAANPTEWLPSLREKGALELIDEQRRELIPATDEEITRLTTRLAGWVFNVRWTVGQPEP